MLANDTHTFIPLFPLVINVPNLPPIRPDEGEWIRIHFAALFLKVLKSVFGNQI